MEDLFLFGEEEKILAGYKILRVENLQVCHDLEFSQVSLHSTRTSWPLIFLSHAYQPLH